MFNRNSKLVIKSSEAVYISSELKSVLDSLDPGHKKNKWIEKMKIDLKANMLKGKKIKKEQIPDHYIQRYEVDNLFQYRHPEGYRSCYTLYYFEGPSVCPVILDLNPHPKYDKIFGYKTS